MTPASEPNPFPTATDPHTNWTDAAAQWSSYELTPTDISLGPTHRIPFATTDLLLGVEFSPDGHTAYALVNNKSVDLTAVAISFWPETLGVLVGLLALAWLFRALRILKRPQIRGAPHCPRCNYCVEAQAPDSAKPRRERRPAPPGTLCPECGTNLAHRPPCRGRAMWRRLVPSTLVLILAGAGYAAMHGAGFLRVPKELPYWAPRLWSQRADAYATTNKPAWLTPHLAQVTRLVAIDTTNGTISRTLRTTRGLALDLLVSDDGLHIALAERRRIRWIRTSDGISIASTVTPSVAGIWDPVSRSIIAGVDGLPSSPNIYYGSVDTARVRTLLKRWSPATGECVTLLDEDAVAITPQRPLMNRYILLRHAEGSVVASASPTYANEHIIRTWHVSRPDDPTQYAAPSQRIEGLTAPRDGGALYMVATSQGLHARAPSSRVPLSFPPLAGIDSAFQNIALSRDGAVVFLQVHPQSILVCDASRQRWSARLWPPQDLNPRMLAASPDGQRLAVIAWRDRRPGGTGNVDEMLFYELPQIVTPEPGPMPPNP